CLHAPATAHPYPLSLHAALPIFSAPLELRNSRLMLTMETPFQTMFSRFSSVTVATGVASRFSSLARAMNLSTSSGARATAIRSRSEEHTSELQSRFDLVCRLLLE